MAEWCKRIEKKKARRSNFATTHLLLREILRGSVAKGSDDGQALFLDGLEYRHAVLAASRL